ncbi:MAG: energy-coupling factor transporter transmembrane component T [Candidatus Bathyarchaeia archaeon]
MPSSVLQNLMGISARRTVLHRLHVVTRFVIAFSIGLAIVFITGPGDIYLAVSLLLLSIILILLGGVPVRALSKFLVVIVTVTVFIGFSFIFLTQIPGETTYLEYVLMRIETAKGPFMWKLLISDRTMTYLFIYCSRIVIMVFSAIFLLGTIDDREVIWGMRSVGLPYGATVVAALFFRGISLFADDFFTVRDAMTVRGVDFAKAPLLKRLRLYFYSLIPIFSLMLRRSYDISLALESRGLSPTSKPPIVFRQMRFKTVDYLVTLLCAAAILGVYLEKTF